MALTACATIFQDLPPGESSAGETAWLCFTTAAVLLFVALAGWWAVWLVPLALIPVGYYPASINIGLIFVVPVLVLAALIRSLVLGRSLTAWIDQMDDLRPSRDPADYR